MRYLIILFAVFLTGCTHLSPHLEVGLAYQVDGMTDWIQRTDRSWTCNDNTMFIGEAGVEHEPSGVVVSYVHESYVLCGKPFNSHPELYQDYIKVSKEFF